MSFGDAIGRTHTQRRRVGRAAERREEREERRGCVALDRKNPPFAENRKGWGTLKFFCTVT